MSKTRNGSWVYLHGASVLVVMIPRATANFEGYGAKWNQMFCGVSKQIESEFECPFNFPDRNTNDQKLMLPDFRFCGRDTKFWPWRLDVWSIVGIFGHCEAVAGNAAIFMIMSKGNYIQPIAIMGRLKSRRW
jgi:hypothetical protein